MPWERPRPTTTTTGTSISSSPACGRTSCCATAAMAASRTSPGGRASPAASGAWPPAWFDYDNDGRLDLLVVNYVQWSPDTNRFCGDDARGIRIYCHPRVFQGLPNRLYRNRGDGTFEDVSARAGLLAHVGKGMSAAFADFDHDGRLDMFVTNDTVPNFLFRNKGDGTFEETALFAGVSVPDSAGRSRAWAPIFRITTTTAGRTSISPRSLARRSRSFATTSHAAQFVETTQVRAGLATGLTVEGVGLVHDRRRHRQRWLEGHLHRQLARERPDRRLRSDRLQAGQQPVPQRRPRPVSRRDGGLRPRRTPSRPIADAAWPTSTATAASIVVVLVLGAPAELWKNDSAPDQPVAHRPARRHAEQSRRHRRACHRRQSGAHDDDCRRLRVVITRGGALRMGAATRSDRVEVQWPSGTRQIDRESEDEPDPGNQREVTVVARDFSPGYNVGITPTSTATARY